MYATTLRSMLHALAPDTTRVTLVKRVGQISIGRHTFTAPRVLLDTGASSGNYLGRELLERIELGLGRELHTQPCRHTATLGDGKSLLQVTRKVILPLALEHDVGEMTTPISTEFYVVDTLGEEVIIGIRDIMGAYFDFFVATLLRAKKRSISPQVRGLIPGTDQLIGTIQQIQNELDRRQPNVRVLDKLKARVMHLKDKYLTRQALVRSDPSHNTVLYKGPDSQEGAREMLYSRKHGSVCAGLDFLYEIATGMCEPVSTMMPGETGEPWTQPLDEVATEESDTPDPLSISEDVLKFMELSPDEARAEYIQELQGHVSSGMLEACPQVLELLTSDLALDVFVPREWNGMKVPPLHFTTRGELPTVMKPPLRPVKPALLTTAKAELERLKQYFYVESDSPIASPLVIVPKATQPFIRFCGDYRKINEYIDVPQQPIPVPKYELEKAAKYKYFVDLDMANSFHQLPLTDAFSKLLSVQTPWGLFRPKFLPEGVSPASGALQAAVREIFKDFSDWTIVIFDNFLVLADSYTDAYEKLQKILQRCKEYSIVLKLKKSWIGVQEVEFFGYKVTNGQWALSQSRKDAISAMAMPTSVKDMQRFLGAALFFHHHLPNYSEWSARLYAMTHKDFNWKDKTSWDYDYEGHFELFKKHISDAVALHFPDYSLPWVIRCDASLYAVGAVLYQIRTHADGTTTHEAIGFTSKRFSKPATNWDAYKREAFAIYHAVQSFHYYLRGKRFELQTDYYNLVWIQTSQSPIVVRWRALLQSYDFLVRHIPGRDNKVADWLSRMGYDDDQLQPGEGAGLAGLYSSDNVPLEQLLSTVHGNKELHYGAYETWRRARLLYPEANITIQSVRDFVRECPLCQKTRDTGIRGLPEVTRSLKDRKSVV